MVHCEACGGLVKPDIVFFGEHLPERFFSHKSSDLQQAELLIILGTSLVVHPFASLIDDVHADCPRLLVNREVVGVVPAEMHELGYNSGLWFGDGNRRDAKFIGDCDDGVVELARLLGWQSDFSDVLRERDALAIPLAGAAPAGADDSIEDSASVTTVANVRGTDAGADVEVEQQSEPERQENEELPALRPRHVFAAKPAEEAESESAVAAATFALQRVQLEPTEGGGSA